VVTGDARATRGGTEWVVFAVAALLYVLVPSRNANYADDSMRWALSLTNPPGLINVHHLFLNGLQWVYRGALPLFGGHLDPARLLAIYNALWGAVGLAALFRLLREAGLGRVALPATIACGASAGYWAYSIVGDVYVPAIALLVIGAGSFIRGLRTGQAREQWRHGAVAVVAFVLALLHHQAHFALIAGLGLGALCMRGGLAPRELRFNLAVLLACGAITLVVYAAVFRATPHAPGTTFRHFASGYVESFNAHPDQKSFSPRAAVNAAAGVTRAAFATHVIFRSAALTRAIQNRFPYRNLYPYPYLVRRLGPLQIGIILLGLLAAASGLGFLLARGAWRAVREREEPFVLLLAAIPQALLFVWWEAISDEFWLWALPILAVLVGLGAAGEGRARRIVLTIAVTGLIASSWFGAIALFADPGNDIDAVNGRFVAAARNPDLIVGWNEIQSSARIVLASRRTGFRYFNVFVRAFAQDERLVPDLRDSIAGALERGGRVRVDPYVTHPPLSNLADVRLTNPAFEEQRQSVLRELRAADSARVDWMPLEASVPGYFLEDSIPVR
jgi:hypothetical protein